jgi:hypothetical protein
MAETFGSTLFAASSKRQGPTPVGPWQHFLDRHHDGLLFTLPSRITVADLLFAYFPPLRTYPHIRPVRTLREDTL